MFPKVRASSSDNPRTSARSCCSTAKNFSSPFYPRRDRSPPRPASTSPRTSSSKNRSKCLLPTCSTITPTRPITSCSSLSSPTIRSSSAGESTSLLSISHKRLSCSGCRRLRARPCRAERRGTVWWVTSSRNCRA